MTRHETLASLWCQYNGQRGTPKQVAKVLHLPEPTLERMLAARGVEVAR